MVAINLGIKFLNNSSWAISHYYFDCMGTFVDGNFFSLQSVKSEGPYVKYQSKRVSVYAKAAFPNSDLDSNPGLKWHSLCVMSQWMWASTFHRVSDEVAIWKGLVPSVLCV